MKIKIGHWVKLNKCFHEHDWFTDEPLRVIDIKDVMLYLDHDFSMFSGRYDNKISVNLVYYFPLRELKLKRILEDI